MGLSMHEKKALTREVSKRYQKAGKKEKTNILDELVKTTGYNRKYALHILANLGKTSTVHLCGKTVRLKASPRKRKKGGGRKPVYTGEFVTVLRVIWTFFWYRCGTILAPFIREQMHYLEGAFRITHEVKELLLKVSPATIDRKLRADKEKLALKGKNGTKPGNLLKKQIPVRTYYPNADKKCGFFEADTVHHCGMHDSGVFCLTLSATDVYSGWIELRALLNKASKWVLEALQNIKASLPFPLLGLDSDNGSEFINVPMLNWCADEHIQFTRTRSYHKNDNCFVEQKNNACVRNFIGYNNCTE
jgi:IS30 family transposase